MTRRFVVHGKVQGVGFRWFVSSAGRRLGLRGLVRNLDDGTVEVIATGVPLVLLHLEKILAQGPPRSEVTAVDAEDADDALTAAYATFDIER